MPSKWRRGLATVAGLALVLAFQPGVSADEGPAWWYGPGFHGRYMANGQIFDMYDPTTTANNEYPLGTWLRVTNPATGRSVDVQVRDRGGFGHGLDMSYAAFFAIADTSSPMRVIYEVIPEPGADPVPTVQTAVVANPAADVVSGEHVVKQGENLYTIARQYGLELSVLASANGIANPALIKVGQHLIIPGVGAPERAASSRSGAREVDYVVQPGDTLYRIAQANGIGVDAIIALNGIVNPNLLAPGQHLKLPILSGSSPAERTVEVREGDTLYDIATALGLDVDELAALNALDDPSLVRPGDILLIP